MLLKYKSTSYTFNQVSTRTPFVIFITVGILANSSSKHGNILDYTIQVAKKHAIIKFNCTEVISVNM